MKFQTIGDKSNFISNQFRNAETVTISAGMGVVYQFSGTEDGLRVVLPSTAGAAKTAQAFAGIASEDIAPNQLGSVQMSGYCRNLRLVRQTRPTSTDTWQTEAAIATSVLLSMETVGNGFATLASSSTGASNTTISQSFIQFPALLMQSFASYASSASATSDTRTAITASAKAILRTL